VYLLETERGYFCFGSERWWLSDTPPVEIDKGLVARPILSAALFLKQETRETTEDSFPKVTIEGKPSQIRLEVDAGACPFRCVYCQMREFPEYTPIRWSYSDFRDLVLRLKQEGLPYGVSIARNELSINAGLQRKLVDLFLDHGPELIRYFTNGAGFGRKEQPMISYLKDHLSPTATPQGKGRGYRVFFACLVSTAFYVPNKAHWNILTDYAKIEKSLEGMAGLRVTIVLLTDPFNLPDPLALLTRMVETRTKFDVEFCFDILVSLKRDYREAGQVFRLWSSRFLNPAASSLFGDVYGQFGTLRNFFWPHIYMPKSVNAGSFRVLVGGSRMSIEHSTPEPIDHNKIIEYRTEDYLPCRSCPAFPTMPHGCLERIRKDSCFWFYSRCENCIAVLQCGARREAGCLTEQDCLAVQLSVEFQVKLGLWKHNYEPQRILEALTDGKQPEGSSPALLETK